MESDATGPHNHEKPSNKPDLLMLVLWSTSGWLLESKLYEDSGTLDKSKRCKEYNLVVPISQKDKCRCSTWKLPTVGHHEYLKTWKVV